MTNLFKRVRCIWAELPVCHHAASSGPSGSCCEESETQKLWCKPESAKNDFFSKWVNDNWCFLFVNSSSFAYYPAFYYSVKTTAF